MIQQVSLGLQPVSEAGQRTCCTDHAMTGSDYGNRVAPVSRAYRAGCGRTADRCCYRAVAAHFTERDLEESRPDLLLKISALEIERKIEAGQAS